MREVETLIVGGGISGIATAWQLDYLGNDVEVWESDDRIGGKIKTEQSDGYITEQAASMVLNFRPEVTQFLQESGLENHKLLRTPTAKRYLINNGNLQEMPMKMAGMLFSPLWSLPGKLRLMLEPFILKGGGEHESVADFIRRRLGNEMLDKALGAYISGTLASDPEKADSYSVLPHLTTLEKQYGSLTAGVFARKIINKKKASITEGFSFQGGMTTLVQELSKQLGNNIHTGYKITAISPHKKGWLVNAETEYGEQSCYTKNLVLSTPAPVTANLLKPLNSELYNLLNDIRYAPLSIVHLGYNKNNIKHDVEGTGFLTPFNEKLKLNGSMWMHSLFSERAPQGQVLLSNYIGGSRYPDIVSQNEQYQVDTVSNELESLLDIKGDPEWMRVNKHTQALPLYHGNYTVRQQAIEKQMESMSGLYLQANYLGGVSIRDRLVCARALAKKLSKELSKELGNTTHNNPQESPLILKSGGGAI